MQGDDDILWEADPNLALDLEELSLEGPSEAGQAVGSATLQKLVPAHRTHHVAKRGYEIPLISNLRSTLRCFIVKRLVL